MGTRQVSIRADEGLFLGVGQAKYAVSPVYF